LEEALVHRRKGISPVWILPLVALCIGGWLVYKGIRDDGIDITVRFPDATGISAGKTQVVFKGVPVGLVRRVEIDEDLKQVEAHIEMVKETEDELVEDMQFWIVRPEVGIRGISGLETLIAGNHIGMAPGKAKTPARVFQGLSSPSAPAVDASGLRLRLLAANSANLKAGSPVQFRSFPVGEVLSVELTPDGNRIALDILLYDRFRSLINSTTVFWNSSGLALDANLSGVRLQVDSVTSLLSGGISFETQPGGRPIDPEKPISLHATKSEALLSRGRQLVFRFDSMEGVKPGAPIRYRGMDVGEVVTVKLSDDLQSLEALGHAYPKFESLFKDGTHVWLVRPRFGLEGVKNPEAVFVGSYLALVPGGERPHSAFDVHRGPPPVKTHPEGITVVLRSERPDSLQAGSPVYFRQVQIGEILHMELTSDSRSVDIFVGIDETYAQLVRESSRFWNASGIRLSGGLMSKMQVSIESLQSLVGGGVTMAVPEEDPGRPVQSGHVFDLLREPPKGWEKWSLEIQLDAPPDPAAGEKHSAQSRLSG
jgi:paraquat-inducible protein B